MKISGWGKYPIVDAEVIKPGCTEDISQVISTSQHEELIARGLGRSYGDSSLASSILESQYLDRFVEFDDSTGILTSNAGVSISDILDTFVPKGWFPPVTPGTKFVTLGGAIACDVHGKNHHKHGCFSDHVISFKIATVNAGIVECSRNENRDLFLATCGGMGLTGIILEVTLKLKAIQSSFINETIIKTKNLDEVLDLFEEHSDKTYSVAWIDCLSTGKSLGRSLLMLGEHADSGGLELSSARTLSVPIDMPSSLLNKYTINAFNSAYYHKNREKIKTHVSHYSTFFYPLDGIDNWNRMYGSNGFTQYQFVIPKSNNAEGLRKILEQIALSKKGSFLAVLKAFGKENDNYLSFPMAGYTLALDFKLDDGVFKLLDELDDIVLEYGGRLYLCKDSRMPSKMLDNNCYPMIDKFREVRRKYDADLVFHSKQSRRLGL